MIATTALRARPGKRSVASEPYTPFNPYDPRLSIKHGAMFLVTDPGGMVPGLPGQGFGLYRDDTRWLSRWNIRIAGDMLALSTGDTDEGKRGSFAYINSNGTLHAERDLVINEGLSERLTIKNTSEEVRTITLIVEFANDFADMFEVRGTQRSKRGETHAPMPSGNRQRVTLSYTGLDRMRRSTFIDFVHPRPQAISKDRAVYTVRLAANESRVFHFHVANALGTKVPARPTTTFEQEHTIAGARYAGWMQFNARISTDSNEFNAVLERAYGDIYSLRQEGKHGFCLAAGVPWFAVPFGRDDFITALQTLRFMPGLSAEILEFFAHYQCKRFDDELDAEPGKMPHEIRTGEMANCAEIAFRPYYGTVDATQLWLVLLSQYVVETGDLDLPRRLWKNVRAADGYLSRATANGTTPIFYGAKPGQALANRCWKDSHNSMVYADGSQPKDTAIAVCEAQGYLYQAWLGLGLVADKLGHETYARKLRAKAARLKRRFERDFWMPGKEFVAMAVDGDGRQLDVISSNPGHLLGTGILSRQAELKVADRLMREDMFSGWGIRTLASSEKAYDPADYQVGSVWPHDNGFPASAMPALGKPEYAHRIFRSLFETALNQADLRLPELFCGNDRVEGQPHVPYNVACVPQAWAAGCWFHMLSGMMKIETDGLGNRISVVNPALPAWLGTVQVTGLRVGDAEIDLEFSPGPGEDGKTFCRVTRMLGDVHCHIVRE